MKANAAALLSGLVFGAGLLISGMTDPAKVRAFLDVFGEWDASLAFVMAGAIGVHFVLRRVVKRRARPLFDATFHEPAAASIDRPLVIGAALFGVGWGIGGVCPGPGIVLAGSGSLFAIVFVAAAVAGMFAARMGRRSSS